MNKSKNITTESTNEQEPKNSVATDNMTTTESGVIEIELDRLKIHPKNIRTSYEGIDELAASIRKNGILQNLTVVPDGDGTYTVVIGNRRLMAAREAGLKTAPCRVMQMKEADQSVSMLTENMNRKNLKIYEEAAGTQMCLSDYGLTIDDLAEMTGLSAATIHHRANVAKLDQKALKKKAEDSNFQLSITDLEKLEKIGNIATRNKILREAKDSRDLAWKAQAASDEEKKQKAIKRFEALAKKQGIEPAPEGADREMYGNKWATVKEYPLMDAVPEKLDIKDSMGVYYIFYYRSFKLIRKAKKEKKPLTEKQQAEKAVSKNRRQAKAIYKEMHEQMRSFVCGMITGKVQGMKDRNPLIQAMWTLLVMLSATISNSAVVYTLTGKGLYELPEGERAEAVTKASSLALHHAMLAVVCSACKGLELIDYNGHYVTGKAEILKKFYTCLAEYGFSFSDKEYNKFMDGTHEVFTATK
ncbi:MAG: ParB/RepB/Spo0J family partition protein [Lachnospiraceae bacterium]|nr:ParB/RepB/Spo0J family partition protein [Lachnospiraceae bacterium]